MHCIRASGVASQLSIATLHLCPFHFLTQHDIEPCVWLGEPGEQIFMSDINRKHTFSPYTKTIGGAALILTVDRIVPFSLAHRLIIFFGLLLFAKFVDEHAT